MMLAKPLLLQASRVTFAYLSVFTLLIFVQTYAKALAMKAARKRKETDASFRFNRYQSDDPFLLQCDRAVGNFLEWAPSFLGFFWMHVLILGDSAVLPGYVYVGARALYPVLAASGGISRRGASPIIFASTVPAYLALCALSLPLIPALFSLH
jgi:hypothetical protein